MGDDNPLARANVELARALAAIHELAVDNIDPTYRAICVNDRLDAADAAIREWMEASGLEAWEMRVGDNFLTLDDGATLSASLKLASAAEHIERALRIVVDVAGPVWPAHSRRCSLDANLLLAHIRAAKEASQ